MQQKNFSKFNQNLGVYIPYAILYPKLSYDFLDDLSFMVKNINRIKSSGYNIFKWKNNLDNQIKNLIYIYIHFLTISLNPWITKIICLDIDKQIIDYIIQSNLKKELFIDLINQINQNYTIQISYIDSEIIDFSLNYDYSMCYSFNINTQIVYLYTRSNKKITDEEFLYVDIDTNNNLNNNNQFNTSYLTKKFSFKVTPIYITTSYVYYQGIGQYLLKNINQLLSLNYININIYNSSYKLLENKYINKQLSDNISDNKIIYCDCLLQFDLNCKQNSKPSCYCCYIRHPLNKSNQIDIAFKIGQIKNELIKNIFN